MSSRACARVALLPTCDLLPCDRDGGDAAGKVVSVVGTGGRCRPQLGHRAVEPAPRRLCTNSQRHLSIGVSSDRVIHSTSLNPAVVSVAAQLGNTSQHYRALSKIYYLDCNLCITPVELAFIWHEFYIEEYITC
jgi:hypothetical protein